MKPIYLDYAAATPVSEECLRVMKPYFNEDFYNPSATYLAGKSTKKDLEHFRRNIAIELGVRSAEIVFTAGATEANNLAIQGVMRQYQEAEVLISAIEHESVLGPTKIFKHQVINVDSIGLLNLRDLESKITETTVMVSIILVNNEIGTIQNLKEVSKILQKYRNQRKKNKNKLPIFLHSDAAQAIGHLNIQPHRLGVDLMSGNGGKIYGPKQSGFLYIKSGVQIKPLIYGGGQEFGIRSGTENVAFAAGLSTAVSLLQQNRESEQLRLEKLKLFFAKELQKITPGICFNGSSKHSAPHILSVTFPGVDNERLMIQLDENGISCAVGSACSASRGESSHVLSAIGLNKAQARSTLRFSFGRETSIEQLKTTVRVLKSLL